MMFLSFCLDKEIVDYFIAEIWTLECVCRTGGGRNFIPSLTCGFSLIAQKR